MKNYKKALCKHLAALDPSNLKIMFKVIIIAYCVQLAYLHVVLPDEEFERRRGPKGDMGPPGWPGAEGTKGSKGDSCASGSFAVEVLHKLSELQKLLPQLSCYTAFNGKQNLLSGQQVVCQDGWTVFQRNKQNNIFDQDWNAYKVGFGHLEEDFWMGLEKLHKLTFQGGCELRVEVWDSDNIRAYAEYNNFQIDDESSKYRLHVSGYSGTAGDGLSGDGLEEQFYPVVHNNMQFTTKDSDNDNFVHNCATRWDNAGWWYNRCWDSVLNRPVGSLQWNSKPKKSSQMMFRCTTETPIYVID